MAISPSPQLLSLLQLREALTTLELLQSFFPLPGELVVSLETTILLPRLEAWIEEQESFGSSESKGKGKGTEGELAWGEKARGGLEFVLRLELRRAGDEDRGDGGDGDGEAGEWVVEMSVVIPLLGTTSTATPPRPDGVRKASTGTTPESSPISYGRQLPKLSVLQPSWLSRSQHIDLVNQFTTLLTLPSSPSTSSTSQTDLVSDDDITTILAAIETLKNLSQSLIPDLSLSNLSLSTPEEIEEEFRVFYHFPSLSTKAKRKDLVDWAAEYGLTGFVLAGKPGILCVEGRPSMIDEYMGEIKSVSWADIPSFQKKVSEKHRTPLLPLPSPSPTLDPRYRVFKDMVEITSLIPQTGARGNRGEMRDVKEYMGERGLGDLFAVVVGVGSV